MATKKKTTAKKKTAAKKKVIRKKTGTAKKTTKKTATKKVASKKKTVKKKSTVKTPTYAELIAAGKKNPRSPRREIEYFDSSILPEQLQPATAEWLSKLTLQKKGMFVAHLMQHGKVYEAAEFIGISKQACYKQKDKDMEFSAAWDAAINHFEQARLKTAEDELYRRAVDGIDKPLSFKGELTGDTIKEKSDILLMFMLKAADPDKYREKVKLDQTTTIKHDPKDLSDEALQRIMQGQPYDQAVRH